MFAEAAQYFRRALDFVKDDEHLYYNLARAHYENGEWEASLDNLVRCHRINPELEVARNLFEVMVGLGEQRGSGRSDTASQRCLPMWLPAPGRSWPRAAVRLRLDEGPVAAGIDIERGRARSGSPVGFIELKRHGRGK